ncbi:hypothetical protein NDU88_001228 [Pleurodeles waltl]|uniref:Uncharacterized protein n=1 Tax=Pleurodeles waltl TaxID=8319 RepID=A0AAV7P4T5_PLEWA|nr:hypothetical protein NDU88_001228 [Pleurodeles waltl]
MSAYGVRKHEQWSLHPLLPLDCDKHMCFTVMMAHTQYTSVDSSHSPPLTISDIFMSFLEPRNYLGAGKRRSRGLLLTIVANQYHVCCRKQETHAATPAEASSADPRGIGEGAGGPRCEVGGKQREKVEDAMRISPPAPNYAALHPGDDAGVKSWETGTFQYHAHRLKNSGSRRRVQYRAHRLKNAGTRRARSVRTHRLKNARSREDAGYR